MYPWSATITNSTTGETLTIQSNDLVLLETLIVNTSSKSVTGADDGVGHIGAISLDTTRHDWLRLQPGDNVLQFSDTGTTDVQIDIVWDRRYFT